MKKVLSLTVAIMMVLTLCAAASAEKTTVTIWTTGSQNVQDLFTELCAKFNETSEDYTAVNQHILSGTGDEGLNSRIAAAYQTGQTNTDFDLIVDNTSSFQSYIDEAGDEGLILDLDTSKLSNYANLTVTPSILPEKLVPYRCTTVVFAYDSARIAEDALPHTWEELAAWIKANPGRFAYNEPDSGGAGSSFVTSAVYRLIDDPAAKTSNDPAWAAFYGAGLDWLADLHSSMYVSGGSVVYPNKNQGTLDLLINQEVDMIPAWADQVLTNVTNGTLPETTCLYQLDDCPLTGSDVSFGIPSIGSNVEGAYAFMDFVISAEGQKICLENMKAIPVIDPSTIDSDMWGLVSSLGDYNFMSLGTLWSDELYPMWQETILPLG